MPFWSTFYIFCSTSAFLLRALFAWLYIENPPSASRNRFWTGTEEFLSRGVRVPYRTVCRRVAFSHHVLPKSASHDFPVCLRTYVDGYLKFCWNRSISRATRYPKAGCRCCRYVRRRTLPSTHLTKRTVQSLNNLGDCLEVAVSPYLAHFDLPVCLMGWVDGHR